SRASNRSQLQPRGPPHRRDARDLPRREHADRARPRGVVDDQQGRAQVRVQAPQGITFHDGAPFDAAAVKFSIERQIVTEHPFNKLGKYPFANYFFGNVKAVEVVDPLTVEFSLKEPRASFLAVLTAGAASIVSPTAVKKL